METQLEYAKKCFRAANAHRNNENAWLDWVDKIETRIITIYGSIDPEVLEFVSYWRESKSESY